MGMRLVCDLKSVDEVWKGRKGGCVRKVKRRGLKELDFCY